MSQPSTYAFKRRACVVGDGGSEPKKNTPRSFVLRPVVISFLLLLLSGTLVPADQGHYGGQIVLSVSSDPKTFNDIVASETSSEAVTGVLFEGLTKTDPLTLNVVPNLAERWEVSPDGLQWTFYLRRDVQWFDGTPFTAQDVTFTFNDLIYNPAVPSSSKDIFSVDGKIFKVEAVDDWTVKFTLPVKFAPFLRSMAQSILPKHKLAKAVADGKFNFIWGIDTPPREIIGTGPFYLDQYRPGERLVFKRNPHYWKKASNGDALPYLNKLIYLIIPDPDAALLKFMDGELDYVSVRGKDFPLLKPLEHKKNFVIYDTGPNFGSNFMTFNQDPRVHPKTKEPFVDPVKLSWFTNVQFRQAVAHAIDKAKINEILFNGLGYPQYGPMSPSTGFFYNPRVTVYDYDLSMARQILADAGFKDRNGDGIIEDSRGHPVEFNLYTNAGAADRVQIAAIIRSDLAKLGMRVNLLTVEFNTLVSKIMASHDWDAIILGLTGGVEPHFGKNVWHSSGQLHVWNAKQEKPATLWEKRLDEIFTQGVQELDENKRKILYDEFQVIVAEQLPVIHTVLEPGLFAVRQKFGNLKPCVYGGAFHNIEEIWDTHRNLNYRGQSDGH